ncbi:hypothetical protein [Amycolatopsis nigrescens]|uniref:hypothetical protein n=1 Tax=Amycolatopsis nigrescens TaxID=381445 RepID=UPI00039A7D1C|nr:hypothetical protein [Amycolatopsis nigrescens]
MNSTELLVLVAGVSILACCLLAGYTVRSLKSADPAKIARVLVALTGLIVAIPAVVYALASLVSA